LHELGTWDKLETEVRCPIYNWPLPA